MSKAAVAIVVVAGIVVACAPLSKTPAASGVSPTNQQQLPGSKSPTVTPGPSSQESKMSLSGIRKADQTVAEIYAGQADLAGTVVNVRGRVVKFSARIMGRNWAHVQDGTGSNGTNDLTVTTMDNAKIGDIVLVSGKITLNKDFGSGYKYALIIEDGKVTVEP